MKFGQLHYFNNHWQVVKAVLSQRAQAGAVVSILYDDLSAPMKKQLKVLHRFPLELAGLLLVQPGTDQDFINKIQLGLVGNNLKTLVKGGEAVAAKDLAPWFEKMVPHVEDIHGRMPELYRNKSGQ